MVVTRLLSALALSVLLGGPVPFSQAEPGYAGAVACASCHAEEYQAWQGSHHDLAMQEATSATVLGDFADSRFDYAGKTSRFFRRDKVYWVETEGSDGKLTEFPVRYVFGVYPLQQYLLPLANGRLQALSIAWDSRPANEGGQRWFHLYPDEQVDYRDPLHWTGIYQNWNSRCAECHSTNLQKNFDTVSDSYQTRWDEINVACEACHGPGEQHIALAQQGTPIQAPHSGFELELQQRGQWQFSPAAAIARRRSPLDNSQQTDNCARCHARRGTLGEYQHGKPLSDTHRLSTLRQPLYHADGQIRDEVYVYGSFIQSKMHRAGVVCSNCHEPHSLKLRAEGNGVCAQCHRPAVYDTPQHHHHTAPSAGAQCVNCHMPETTYMVVDPRRDHSLRIPRPDLSVVIGTPNACNNCHTEQSADWALQALRQWGVEFSDSATHPARTFARAQRGDARAVASLKDIALDTSQAPIWRATALESLGDFGGREAYEAAVPLLQSDDPLIRANAVAALEFLPPNQRLPLLVPLLFDTSTSVRMQLARLLAPVAGESPSAEMAELLQPLFAEYLEIQAQHADMPGVQMQLGVFHLQRGHLELAEAAYQQALQLNSSFVPAMLNLADLYRSSGREQAARDTLLRALAVAPPQAAAHHALGLLETRAGNMEAALEHLSRAAALEAQGVRHRYVYAIALHDTGQSDKAIAQLKAVQRQVPDNPDVLMALVSYSESAGQLDQARHYAERLGQLMPDNPQIQRLLRNLQR